MQLYWNEEFKRRVLLNASKAIVRQLDTGEDYSLIQPVYCLSLVNDKAFDYETDEFYHDYAIVDVEHTDRHIEGLRLVFVELPKFKPQSIAEKKMAVLWLRFLTEIAEDTKGIEEGMQKGIEEGMQKGIYTVARNMKQMGLSIADIAKATRLSEEEITIL